MNEYWIGVDLGGTKLLAGLFDHEMKLVARTKQPTEYEQGADAVTARIAGAVEHLINEAKIDRSSIKGCGMGVPGQIDPKSRMIRYAPNLGWRDYDLLAKLPTEWRWPVVLENDVRMGTYGEFAHGAAKGAKHVLGVFCGTSIGGCLILNGELHTGFNGNGGEIGHTIVHWRKGTGLEQIAGRRAMMKRAGEQLADSPKRMRKNWKNVDLDTVKSSFLADLYAKDDTIAVQLIDDAARALGATIGGMVNFLSPEVVVIGGGVAGAMGDHFLERIWEIALRYTLPGAADGVECVAAALGDDAGIVGSAAFAKTKTL